MWPFKTKTGFEDILAKQHRWLNVQAESFTHPECKGMTSAELKKWRDDRAGFSMESLESQWHIAARTL